MDWIHPTIMATALLTGVVLYRLTGKRLEMKWWEKVGVGFGAFCGGSIGAKLPFVLADWPGLLDGTAWFDDGKTVMAGLVGGYLGVQVAEWALDIRSRMCDSFALPLAAAMAVGRLGCFQAGCCYGTVTSVAWAVDFGDGLFRHPTQLYESAFHLTAAVLLYQFFRRGVFEGQLIRLYFVAYFVYRFLTEFIRPEAALWLGLTGYQWAALVLGTFFTFWHCEGCRPFTWRRRSSKPREPVDRTDQRLKPTRTLCPDCLTPLEGTTYQEDGRVFLRRDCPVHGEKIALICSDRRHYYLRDEAPHQVDGLEDLPATARCGDSCSDACSDSPGHKTCIALLELTDACNLRCPVCFARSDAGQHRSIDTLMGDLEAFLAERGSLDVLQLSGGEPLLHPDFLAILDRCKALPIESLMINTNGLVLLHQDGLAAELARRKPRLELSLQMDGLDAANHETLRGEDLLAKKRAVLERVAEHDLPTTLVCTVAQGVNEDQLGPLVKLGMEIPQVRGVTFQPATWSGRFDVPTDPLDRVTLADVIRLVVLQSDGLLDEDDFKPLPCSNPNCCSFTFLARRTRNTMVPVARFVDYEEHLDQLADRINFNMVDAKGCCGTARDPKDFFRIVVKPFMDVHTYDEDRIDECCIHMIQPGGRAISFCHYNALVRTENGSEKGGLAPSPTRIELS